jgi:hypothetical protein
MTTHNLYTISNTTPTNISEGKDVGWDITIQNVNASGYLYVGGEGVSSTNYGFRVMPNHSISVELPGTDDLFVVASTNGLLAAVLKVNLERTF